MKVKKQIEIYQAKDGSTKINVQLEQDTVWLSQAQMAQLFNKGRTTITEHIRNIFREGELQEEMVCRNFRHTTQHGAIKNKTQKKSIKLYNLDVIISVGYRVKSKEGTQFRIWANSILKDYLVNGYALNKKRLEQKEKEIKLLKDGIHILTRAAGIAIEEKSSNLGILETFAKGLSLLDDYDHEQLDTKGLTTREANYPSVNEYQRLIKQMLNEFDSEVFWQRER